MDNQNKRIEDLRNIRNILSKTVNGEKYKQNYEYHNQNIKKILLESNDKVNSELAYFYNERLKIVAKFSNIENLEHFLIKNVVDPKLEKHVVDYMFSNVIFEEGEIDVELYNECCQFLLRDQLNQSYYTISIMYDIFNNMKIKEKEVTEQAMQLLEEAIVFLLVLSRRLGIDTLAINPYGV